MRRRPTTSHKPFSLSPSSRSASGGRDLATAAPIPWFEPGEYSTECPREWNGLEEVLFPPFRVYYFTKHGLETYHLLIPSNEMFMTKFRVQFYKSSSCIKKLIK